MVCLTCGGLVFNIILCGRGCGTRHPFCALCGVRLGEIGPVFIPLLPALPDLVSNLLLVLFSKKYVEKF